MPLHNRVFVVLILTAGSLILNVTSVTAISWAIVALDAECDTSAIGKEVWLQSLKRTTLTNCQQACSENDECSTITYFFNGLCKLFSTSCVHLKQTDGETSLSLRLITDSTVASTDGTTPTDKMITTPRKTTTTNPTTTSTTTHTTTSTSTSTSTSTTTTSTSTTTTSTSTTTTSSTTTATPTTTSRMKSTTVPTTASTIATTRMSTTKATTTTRTTTVTTSAPTTTPTTTTTPSTTIVTTTSSTTTGCNSEQVAAGILGYTQVSWDNESGKEKQPSSAKKRWFQLTEQERVAAVVLGYTGSTWDKGGKKYQPSSASKYWAELTSCGDTQLAPGCNSEQVAAGILGYTQVSWDNESGKEKQPSSAKKRWHKLTHIERAAAVALGYSGSTWDKGGKKYQPSSASKYWAELTSCDMSNNDEQGAARVLGFTRASWDNVSGMEKQPLSTLKEWVQLSVRERVAANVLGYSEHTWNRVDEQEQPLWMTKRWDELTSHDSETTKKPAPQTSTRAKHTTRTTTHLRASASISYSQDASAAGAISGSVVGSFIGVAAVVVAVLSVFFFVKRKSSREQVKSESPDRAIMATDESKSPDGTNNLQCDETTE